MPISEKPRHPHRDSRAALNPLLRNAINSVTENEWGAIADMLADADLNNGPAGKLFLGCFAQFRGLTDPHAIADYIAARQNLYLLARDVDSSDPDSPSAA